MTGRLCLSLSLCKPRILAQGPAYCSGIPRCLRDPVGALIVRPLELGVVVLRACAKVACPEPDMAQAASRGCLGLSSKTLLLLLSRFSRVRLCATP